MKANLTLKNPKWRKLVAECALEAKHKGNLEFFIAANGFTEEVKAYIHNVLQGDHSSSQDIEAA